jgi:putative ABC transport system substrate-binding protein
MRRRAFLVGSIVGVLAHSLAAEAQQGRRIPRIGWLGFGSPTSPAGLELLDALRQGLREHGWVEGENIAIEYRAAEGQTERYAALASELVRLHVDVLVTSSGEPAIIALKRASATIPIVMAISHDPVGNGLVTSLARPGGNVTGLSIQGTDVAGKRLQLLKEVVPKASRIAILWNATYLGKIHELRETQAAARILGVSLRPVEIRKPGDLPGAFSAIVATTPDALIVFADPLTNTQRKAIVDFAVKKRVPMIAEIRPFAVEGGLMTYGPSVTDMCRRAATYVDKILRGAKPADLPIEQPTKFELAINLGAENALGLTIPQSVLLRADQVIQ